MVNFDSRDEYVLIRKITGSLSEAENVPLTELIRNKHKKAEVSDKNIPEYITSFLAMISEDKMIMNMRKIKWLMLKFEFLNHRIPGKNMSGKNYILSVASDGSIIAGLNLLIGEKDKNALVVEWRIQDTRDLIHFPGRG